MVLAPVHPGYRHQDRHGGRGDEEQPPTPAVGVADDQDRQRHVDAARRGLMPGRVGRGRQVLAEVVHVRPGRLTTAAAVRNAASSPEHGHCEEDDRPPAPGDGEEDHARGQGDDEDRLGRAEGAEDQAPPVPAGVRWAANQCGAVVSPSMLPWPALTISSPRPMTMPTITPGRSGTPAATRPRSRMRAPVPARSGWAGLRSARASGSSPSVTGSVTGSPALDRVARRRTW